MFGVDYRFSSLILQMFIENNTHLYRRHSQTYKHEFNCNKQVFFDSQAQSVE